MIILPNVSPVQALIEGASFSGHKMLSRSKKRVRCWPLICGSIYIDGVATLWGIVTGGLLPGGTVSRNPTCGIAAGIVSAVGPVCVDIYYFLISSSTGRIIAVGCG